MAVLRALASIVGLQGLGAALSLLLVVTLTAILGPESYGYYAWALSFASIGSLLLQLGLPMTILKSFAPLDVRGALPRRLRDTYTIYSFASFGSLVIVAMAVLVVGDLPLLRFALPAGLCLATLKIGNAIQRAGDKSVLAQFTEQVLRVVLTLAGVSLLSWLGAADAGNCVGVYGLSAFVSVAVFLVPVIRAGLGDLLTRPAFLRPDFAHFQVAISRSAGHHLPIFIAGFFVPPHDLAYLAVALQLSAPATFGLVASRTYFAYSLNVAIRKRDAATVRNSYRDSIAFSNFVSLLVSAGLLFVLYASLSVPRLSLPGFETSPDLIQVFVAVLAFRVVETLLGPAQLVGILLDQERYVRNANLACLFLLALGLVGAGVAKSVVGVVLVMTAYVAILNGAIVWRIGRAIGRLGTDELELEEASLG